MSTKSTEENEVLDQLKAQEVHLDLGIEKEKDQDLYPEIELLDVALQVVLKNIITEAGPDQWREEATVASLKVKVSRKKIIRDQRLYVVSMLHGMPSRDG